MAYTLTDLEHHFALCCPECKGRLDLTPPRCSACGRMFQMVNGVPSFLNDDERRAVSRDHSSDDENGFLAFFKRWPRFYFWMTLIIVPIFYTGLTSKKFLAKRKDGERFLNVGSGATLLHPRVVNVDFVPYDNVHVITNAERLPFRDNTFDAVCTDQVLEHVANPRAVVAELLRVTKPGGLIYSAAPFMYPWHPSPKDYSRWSIDGLKMLFAGHEAVESGVLIGPVSGTISVLASGLAVMCSFGWTFLRKVLHYVFMILVTPLKFLDAIFARLPGAEDTAGNVYVVIRKK